MFVAEVCEDVTDNRARNVSQRWNAAGSRLPMIATWAIIIALLAQEGVSGLGTTTLWSGASVAGKIIAIATSLLYALWQWRIVNGVKPPSDGRLVVLLIVCSGAALLIDGQWAPLPLALSAVMLTLSSVPATIAVAAILVALTVEVGLTNPHLIIVMPPGILAMAAVLYAFTRLSMVIRELQLAREELARSRVDEERLRMQRALHDMLGRTLVTASLRNQIALRVLDSDITATREHLEHLHDVLTDGQARLRAVTSGPVILSLADEIESAISLCQRLGIEINVDADPLSPGAPEREVGAIVRESVTNMLKHSNALHCWLTMRSEPASVVVTVVNDGCVSGDIGARDAGTGLAHLRAMAEGLGGILEAASLDDRRFQVSARLPVLSHTTAPPALDQEGQR